MVDLSTQSEKAYDILDCSKRGSNCLPRLVFSVLRTIDPYLQYLIIFHGYGRQIISKVGIPTVPAGPKGTVLVAMAASCAVKQIISMTLIEGEITYSLAIFIGVINTVNNFTNSLATLSSFIYGPSEELGTLQYIGISLFTVGILTDLISELQRNRFDDNPRNKGKLYSGGLFSLARHINYGANTLLYTGLALTSGNYELADIQFFWHMWDFRTRTEPRLQEQYGKKYGDDWKKLEDDVPYALFPYVW